MNRNIFQKNLLSFSYLKDYDTDYLYQRCGQLFNILSACSLLSNSRASPPFGRLNDNFGLMSANLFVSLRISIEDLNFLGDFILSTTTTHFCLSETAFLSVIGIFLDSLYSSLA